MLVQLSCVHGTLMYSHDDVVIDADVPFHQSIGEVGKKHPVVAVGVAHKIKYRDSALAVSRPMDSVERERRGRVRQAVLHQICRLGRSAARVGKVAVPLRHRRNAEITRVSALLFVPFLAVENEEFVLLDRTTD